MFAVAEHLPRVAADCYRNGGIYGYCGCCHQSRGPIATLRDLLECFPCWMDSTTFVRTIRPSFRSQLDRHSRSQARNRQDCRSQARIRHPWACCYMVLCCMAYALSWKFRSWVPIGRGTNYWCHHVDYYSRPSTFASDSWHLETNCVN